jgi:hypothetical protein
LKLLPCLVPPHWLQHAEAGFEKQFVRHRRFHVAKLHALAEAVEIRADLRGGRR